MKNRIASGVIFIILGLLIAIGPQTIFAVCGPMENGKFMKCHWTAQAELGIGFVIAFLAVLILFFASSQIRIGLHFGIIAALVATVFIPTKLIGVCGGEHMQCNALTKPALLVLGAIGIVFGIANVAYLLTGVKKEQISYAKQSHGDTTNSSFEY
ncbi:DUF4418 family protein [Butyrivibrio sp. YAB3001]|uniref:DUF4418 family protein n=1 Tax=Butyrivibrio sp. YAB3001 TaxID=1520812 RepID=UPI0008F61FFA|nr:DUF4418 family protein [Butyrivibrio sp. YAB3001]SFB85183.1 protein of unknown function [Butyrivibrio sp. YAB3001]